MDKTGLVSPLCLTNPEEKMVALPLVKGDVRFMDQGGETEVRMREEG